MYGSNDVLTLHRYCDLFCTGVHCILDHMLIGALYCNREENDGHDPDTEMNIDDTVQHTDQHVSQGCNDDVWNARETMKRLRR
jgi:hypothetical protein